MIAAGYEDGNDADTLRADPMFKLALDRLPSGEELCSQSTISRLEGLPDRRALLRLGRALVEQYCGSFRAVPQRIVLDIDDTFDRVHGAQQLRLFNAYHDDYGFQPIVVFDGEGRFVTALRSAVLFSSAVDMTAERHIGARPKTQSTRFARHQSNTSALSAPSAPIGPARKAANLYSARPLARPCPWPEQGLRSCFKGGPGPRQAAPLHAVLRCRRELEPGGSASSRGLKPGPREPYSLHCHRMPLYLARSMHGESTSL